MPSSTLISGGTSTFTGTCLLEGDLTLSGNQKLVFVNATVTLKGNVKLSGSATLGIRDSTFNLANDYMFHYSMSAVGNSLIDMRKGELKTSSGVTAGLAVTSSVFLSDNAVLRLHDVHFDLTKNWILLTLDGNSTLESQDTSNLPTEAYPQGNANIRICGPKSSAGIWLKLEDGMRADLSDLPSSDIPGYYQFGRNTPNKTNVGYEIYILNAKAGFGVSTHPGSELKVNNNSVPITIGYYIENNTTAIELANLPKGPEQRQTVRLTDQGREVDLTDTLLTPMAWQIYATNTKQPVTIKDSFVNEVAAFANATVKMNNIQFYYAVIAAPQEKGLLEIENSKIECQSIYADGTSHVSIRDSKIYGSVVQANGNGTIFLANNELLKNISNPFAGIGSPVRFQTEGNGMIVAIGVNEFTSTFARGATIALKGDVVVESKVAASKPASYTVTVLNSSQTQVYSQIRSTFGTQVALGTLNTSGWAAGTYVIKVSLTVSGETLSTGRVFQLN
ncbi:MAG: hypothetical protein AB7G93_19600 [Bdellovibrionales bacterium]